MKKKRPDWPFFKEYQEEIKRKIRQALKEDLGSGDVTSQWIFSDDFPVRGKIVAQESGIVAGLKVVEMVFQFLNKKIKFEAQVEEGTAIKKGRILATLKGSVLGILAGERTALNFLQRMSGIATLTSQFVKKVAGTKAIILDTRKTAPGLRIFDKWAVFLGGGENHRMGLDKMVLIKDNHLQTSGGIKQAVALIKRKNKKRLKIEVEAESLAQVKQALECGVDRMMLDNMTLKEIKKAVAMTKGQTKLEVSGGVSLNNVSQISRTGVDYISIGALTHSVKALNINLELD